MCKRELYRVKCLGLFSGICVFLTLVSLCFLPSTAYVQSLDGPGVQVTYDPNNTKLTTYEEYVNRFLPQEPFKIEINIKENPRNHPRIPYSRRKQSSSRQKQAEQHQERRKLEDQR